MGDFFGFLYFHIQKIVEWVAGDGERRMSGGEILCQIAFPNKKNIGVSLLEVVQLQT